MPLSLRIPPDVRALLERTAKAMQLTLTDVVIDAIVEKARREGIE
ncbi:MAG: DUF1778 domain-containing protein [Thermaerobacter sp.]|nr:DUF1778 domain-containing protein [Thermaerobacter sp.]